MEYINTLTLEVYTSDQLKTAFPSISFPVSGPDTPTMQSLNIAEVEETTPPVATGNQIVVANGISNNDGRWQTQWLVRDMTSDEIAARTEDLTDHLADYRYDKETGGLLVNGITIPTDDRSKLLINGAYNRALQEDPTLERTFKVGDSFIQLTNAQLIAIGEAVADHVQKCFNCEATVFANITTYVSYSDVETAFDTAFNAS